MHQRSKIPVKNCSFSKSWKRFQIRECESVFDLILKEAALDGDAKTQGQKEEQ